MAAEYGSYPTTPGSYELVVGLTLIVLIFIIYKAAGKVIVQAMKDRSLGVADRLEKTKVELNQASLDLDKIKNELDQIEDKKQKILNEVRGEATKLLAIIVEEAQKTAAQIVEDARASAENEIRKSYKSLRNTLIQEAVNHSIEKLSASGAEGKKLHSKLIDDLEFKSTSNGGPAHG